MNIFWSEKVFVIRKVNNTVPLAYVINDFYGEEIVGTFYQKEKWKIIRIEKVIKRKDLNYMLNGKNMIIRLIAG